MDAITALLDVGDRRIDFKATIGYQISLCPPIIDAKTVLPDVGDRRIDFQCLADRLAALSTQFVDPEAAKRGP